MSFVAWAVGRAHISANLSESRRSVPALTLFRAVQTETVRLHINASASFELLRLALMVRAPARSVAGSRKLEKAQRSFVWRRTAPKRVPWLASENHSR